MVILALVAATVSDTDVIAAIMLRMVKLTQQSSPPEPQNPKTRKPDTANHKALNPKPHPKPRRTRRPDSCSERE